MDIAAQHSVHPTGGSRRVFKHFAWLEVGSVKMALSRPTHQRVTQAVGRACQGSTIFFDDIYVKAELKCKKIKLLEHYNQTTQQRSS